MGLYKPHLTLYRRWDGTQSTITLRVEFSIPKLLYGNNFDELSDSDFPEVIKTLRERLSEMGVDVIQGKLEKAIVSTIHYWKNIVLTDYTSVSHILSNIAKTNISARFDTGETNYLNWWELFRIHSQSFQIVFYDKIADLNKTKARAVEKDNREINYQMSLFETIKKQSNKTHNSFEVLRMEIRFMNKQKLKKIHKDLKIPFDDPFTFQDAFNMENARKIIEHHWNIFYIELRMLSLFEMKPIDRWNLLLQKSKWRTPTKTLALGMLMWLIADDAYRDVRKQFEAKYHPRTLKRLYDELKEIQDDEKPFEFMETISKAISVYKPLQMKEYLYTGVNNSQ